jgi:hypothetical protein
MSLPTDYSQNKYLAVTFRRISPYIDSPRSLSAALPSSGLAYVGQIGQLREAHLYSVPLASWGTFDISHLRVLNDIVSVEVQEPRVRAKRGNDL